MSKGLGVGDEWYALYVLICSYIYVRICLYI